MSAMLPRAAREEAERAGYIHLDDPERELLADLLWEAMTLSRGDLRLLRDLRDRIRPSYSRARRGSAAKRHFPKDVPYHSAHSACYIAARPDTANEVGTIHEQSDDPSSILCDGREFDPAVYPELKAILRDRFGENRVPDLRAQLVTDGPSRLSARVDPT